MRHRFQSLGRLVVAGIVWLAAARAGAQLATSSPFLPGQSAANANAPTAGAPLEFRGQIDMPPDGLKVRIYDPARKTGAWVRVNERDPNNEFVVKQFDSARGTVSVEYRGQTMVLAEREAKVTSSGAAMPNVPMAGIPMPSAGPQTALNPTPADDQHRLEAVAAEVARRRQLREQAVDQVTQGAPATQPVIQQQQNTQPQPNAPRSGLHPRSP